MSGAKISLANDLPVLTALTNEDSYPYNFRSKNQISGLVYDIVKTLSLRSGYILQTEALPWTRALQTARDTPGILVFSLARNPERENSYYWIGPVTTSEVWLFKLKKRTDIQLTTLNAMKTYTIGDVASSSTIALLTKYGVKVDVAPNNLSNCRKLKAGRIDLFPFDPNGISIFLQSCGLKMEDIEKSLQIPRDTSLYIALGKSTPKALVDHLNAEFQKMIKDKTVLQIHRQWQIDYKLPSS